MTGRTGRPHWRHHPATDWFITLVCAQLLLLIFHYMALGSSANLRLYDYLVMKTGYTARPDIVVVSIDDPTIEDHGGWPLQRRHYADLLQRMSTPANRPKAIGLDLLFIDSTDDDMQLAQALHDLPVVLPLTPIESSPLPALSAPSPNASMPDNSMVIPPSLARAVQTYGHILLAYDQDGISRSIAPNVPHSPHMALAMMQRSQDPDAVSKVEALSQSKTRQRFRMVDPEVGFTTISLKDALNPHLSADFFKDKWVLIGVTSPSLGDHHATAYTAITGASTPGVYIIASVLNEALNGQWISVLPDTPSMLLGLIWVMLTSLALFWSNPSRVFVVTPIALLMLCGIDLLLLSQFNTWANIMPSCIVIGFMGGFWSWRRLMTTVNILHLQLEKTQANAPLKIAKSPILPDATALFLNPFVDTTHRVVEELNTAIELQKNDLALLNSILQQIPEPVAIFDAGHKHLTSNQAMNGLARKLQLNVHSSAHYDFDQLVNALQISKSRALHSGQEETTVSLSQYNLPNLYFIFRTSEIQSNDVYKLKLVTLSDITASQRHQIQREQTLQFLSHDMRTPVAAILALKKRLLLLPTNNMPQVQACADQITQNAQRLMDMMDGFIVHSQAEQMPLHLTGCLVSDLLDDAIEQAQPLADQHHIQLQLMETPALLRIMVDTHLIVRALLNLLHNAIRHGMPGSCVIIRTSPHAGQVQPMARIEILNPIGAMLPDNDVKGFGLGLKFVKTTIQRHDGKFHLQIPYQEVDDHMAWIALDIPLYND